MARIPFLRFALGVMLLTVAPAAHTQTRTQPENLPKVQPQKGVQIELTSMKTPLIFEPNRGQAVSEFQWTGRGAGFKSRNHVRRRDAGVSRPQGCCARETIFCQRSRTDEAKDKTKSVNGALLKFHLLSSNSWRLDGVSPTGGISNYFIGNTPIDWHTDVPHYAQVKATGVYPGIDLVFRGDQTALAYDFVVGPGADPKQIQLQFEGAARLQVDTSTGDLVVATAGGTELRHAQPKIHQEVSGKKVSVKGGFQILKGDTAGFTLEEYDPKQPLVIDPTISFVRFLGGSNTDEANAVAVDGSWLHICYWPDLFRQFQCIWRYRNRQIW